MVCWICACMSQIITWTNADMIHWRTNASHGYQTPAKALMCVVLQCAAWTRSWQNDNFGLHDDVMKWKHFPRYWPFVRGIHRSPVNSPHKGQWRGALMFSLICVWINGWVNNREAGDLRRYRAHYDVTVMVNGQTIRQNDDISVSVFKMQLSVQPKTIFFFIKMTFSSQCKE